MNPADLDAGGGDAARRAQRRAETEARLTDSLVAEAVGPELERAIAAQVMRACAAAEPALAEAAAAARAAMEAALPAQMEAAAAAARAEAEAAAAAARAEEEAAAAAARAEEEAAAAAARKAEAERARADELRLIQLQAELAARESAESRLKSKPEAEASRPKLSFGFKPMKASR